MIEPPSPFVVRALKRLGSITQPETGRALDLACGRGRHALLLAEHGFHVEAVDYAPAALRTLREAARQRGRSIACIAADVTAWPIPRERYDCVVVVNFLDRALFPALRACVAPGGVLLYETHRHDDTDASRNTVRTEFQLAPGELEDLCRGWTVLLRENGVAEHRDRLGARAGILARKPCDERDRAGAH